METKNIQIRTKSPIISISCLNNMITSVVIIINYKTQKKLINDRLHEGRISNVIFTPDGKKLISTGEDGQIIVRSLE